MRRRDIVRTIVISAALTVLGAVSAYAETISYIRADLEYPPYVGAVHPELISFSSYQTSDSFDMDFSLDFDPQAYKEGEYMPITMTFTAKEGNDFRDIKKGSIKVSDITPDEIELSGDATVLTAHFNFPALSVQLDTPKDPYFEKNGDIGWEPVENADYYEVEIESIDDYGQRCYEQTVTAKSNEVNIKEYIYQEPKDYLYSVVAKSDRYFRLPSERTQLPLSMDVMITDDDIGYKSGIVDANGMVWLDGNYIKNKELKIAGEYYYFGKNGQRTYGWRKDGTSWYYYDIKTLKRVGGPQTIDGNDYFFDEETGVMQTGFVDYNGSERFYGGDGKAKTGWVAYDGKIYYILPTGERNLSQLQDEDKRNYMFDKEGVLIQ